MRLRQVLNEALSLLPVMFHIRKDSVGQEFFTYMETSPLPVKGCKI
jgi:hypothetical protein